MSRHNRRRTRGSHKSSSSPSQPAFHPDSFSLSPLSAPTAPSSTMTSLPPRPRRNDLSAKHWHNRYLAWQVRERRQSEERAKLAAEKKRIFGGDFTEEGEEDRWLGERMMEYFGGLDFIIEG